LFKQIISNLSTYYCLHLIHLNKGLLIVEWILSLVIFSNLFKSPGCKKYC
jgi:hypothetical protein